MSVSENVDGTMAIQEDGLTGVQLEYLFARAAGFEVIGSERGPFALHSEDENRIVIFGAQLSARLGSFNRSDADVPLDMAQELGATLRISGARAICEIGPTVASGSSYLEAVMRALVAHLTEQQSRHPCER